MNHQNFWPSLERVPINEENWNVEYVDARSVFGNTECHQAIQYYQDGQDVCLKNECT